MKKAIIALLTTILAAFGYVAVDKTTDARLATLESQMSSQVAVISSQKREIDSLKSYNPNGWKNLSVGDIIYPENIEAPFIWNDGNGNEIHFEECHFVLRKKGNSIEDTTSIHYDKLLGNDYVPYRYFLEFKASGYVDVNKEKLNRLTVRFTINNGAIIVYRFTCDINDDGSFDIKQDDDPNMLFFEPVRFYFDGARISCTNKPTTTTTNPADRVTFPGERIDERTYN